MPSILIIDDDVDVRTLLQAFFQREGYDVVVAHDGRSGTALYHENPTDLIITDIIMPNKEGIETISGILKDFPDARIIAISGGGQSGNLNVLPVASKLGAMRTFAKPFQLDEILEAVHEIIGRP